MARSGRGAAGLRLRAVALALGMALASVVPDGAGAADLPRFEVAGGTPDLRGALEAASLLRETLGSGQAEPAQILAAALADYRRLVETLQAHGHFSGVVNILIDGREAAEIPLLAVPRRIGSVVVRVRPGPPFRFGRAEIAPLPEGVRLPQAFAPGQPAATAVVVEAVGTAIEGWRGAGHAKARVAGQEVVADHPRARLDVAVAVDPGPRLSFGALRSVSPSAVRPERLRAIAGLPEGAPFSPEAVRRAAERLRRTGAFASVSLAEAERPGADGTLDMELTVVDAPPRRVGLGAELSSLEGLELSGFWLHRNLRGGAERLRFDGRLRGIGGGTGGVDYELGARLDVPALIDADTHGLARLRAASLDETVFTADSLTFGLGLRRDFSDSLSGEIAAELSWSEADDDYGRRRFGLLALPATLTWDRRDSRVDAREGHYLSVEAMPFLGFADAGSGLRALVDARIYRRLGGGADGSGGVVLAGRLQAGSILGPDLTGVRPDLLFFSGGAGSVRGQPYQSLGVTRGGLRSGGLNLLTLSLEARFPIRGAFGGVAFVDAGHVGAGSLPGTDGSWHAGAGVGLRYATGLGPVRLDLAVPVGGGTGSGLQVYLGLGQAF